MTTGNRIEIPFSKSKIAIMLTGSLAFVAIGFWFVLAPPQIENSYWGNPEKLTVMGYAAIVFFGLCAFVFVRKLQGSGPGLVIDEEGIVDHSGALAAGRILWSDIKAISVLQINKQKLIMLVVAHPQQYIDREKNLFKRKAMELNLRMYKTPVSITANALKIPFDELLTLLAERLEKAKSNAEQSI